ncbi:MAG: HEAT repeat domain-containing protein [Gemmatimonadota bacterium]|nr:HEAT repeat domain-containing protein [Gemmatimonadota bacterium]
MADAVSYGKSLTMLLQGIKTGAPEEALRADLVRVRRYARSMPLMLELNDGTLLVDGEPVDALGWGLKPLVEAMQLHDIARITILEGAVPKELLQLAVLLARARNNAHEVSTVFEEGRELALWSVRLIPVARADSSSPYAEQASEHNAKSPDDIAPIAEDLALKVASATNTGNAAKALASLALLQDCERTAPDMIRQTQWTYAFDKAATPQSLALAASLLPDQSVDTGSLRLVLKRAGDDGAAALIALLPTVDDLNKRRMYFDAIVELGKGVSLLVEALGAWQWYIARNAALLLGEMKAVEAEPALGRLLSHHDERVRVAVTAALTQLDTPSARLLVQSAIHDVSADVRRRAVRIFATGGSGSVSASDLLTAIAVEKDSEVQVEILYALGRVASVDAVQKLIRLCSQSGAADKPASYRIAAIEALTAARRSAALPFLRAMLSDSEPTIRATARSLIESVNAMATTASR